MTLACHFASQLHGQACKVLDQIWLHCNGLDQQGLLYQDLSHIQQDLSADRLILLRITQQSSSKQANL